MSRQLMVVIFCLAACPATAFGQTEASGYAVAGPAWYTGFFGGGGGIVHAVGGGEVLVHGVGVGGEVGLLGNSGNVLGVLSINGVVRPWRRAGAKIAPFLTAGYTRMGSGDGSFDAWNVAAGATVWTGRHAGVRIELRDHVRPDRRGTVQYFAMRVGIALR
jgi:hypothetical protein